LYLQGILRHGLLQSGDCYTLNTSTTPALRQCCCRMLGTSLCPDTQQPTVTRLKTCSHHCQKIGVLHGERRRDAQRHMPRLTSAPQPAGRGFNVRRAGRARRHWQFGTPCVLAREAERVRNQCLQMGGKGGNWDQGGGIRLHLGGLFAWCSIFTLLGRLSNWAPCGSLLGDAWSRRFPIIVRREPQLLLKGSEPPILCCLSCCRCCLEGPGHRQYQDCRRLSCFFCLHR
jgi:hypothetical protein